VGKQPEEYSASLHSQYALRWRRLASSLMKKIHQLPSGDRSRSSGAGRQETGDSEIISIYSPHTPHPTPQLNYLICAMMIVLG
jgi:hypothetical protein